MFTLCGTLLPTDGKSCRIGFREGAPLPERHLSLVLFHNYHTGVRRLQGGLRTYLWRAAQFTGCARAPQSDTTAGSQSHVIHNTLTALV